MTAPSRFKIYGDVASGNCQKVRLVADHLGLLYEWVPLDITKGGLPASIGHIRADKLRPLAVTTALRSETLLNIPSLSQFLPGFEASAWGGFGVPKNTLAEIVEKLNKEINAGLADPEIKGRLADLGSTPFPGSPADFAKLIADETEKWGNVIRALNIKAD